MIAEKKLIHILLLPTKKENFCLGLQPNGILKYGTSIDELGVAEPHHLYILSDDEIKEGDDVFVKNQNRIVKSTKFQGVIGYSAFDGFAHIYFTNEDEKVVDSTDKIAEIEKENLNVYINEFNKKNKKYFSIEVDVKIDEKELIDNVKEFINYYENEYIVGDLKNKFPYINLKKSLEKYL